MKAYKRLSILCIAVLLCALLPVLAGATSPGDPPEAVDPNAVYVSVGGNDATGAGSQGAPYATLAKAVEMAAQQESATIYVMSNLTMSECARFWAGDITITSAPGAETPYTISRGKDMESVNDSVDPVQDMARGGYNPALIEVGNSARLTLENIILDDGHFMAYTYKGNAPYASAANPVFVQVDASRGGNATDDDQSNDHLRPGSTMVGTTDVSNSEIVQDAIIATYSGDATITLGNGAVLQNYGGMSAVRVSGGTLVMESGSKICDSDNYTRIKGAPDSYGPAGAVWVQSGKVEMQEGSSIENMNGRAIYADGAGSDVTVDGLIENITPNAKMWNSSDGFALHLRGGAKGVVGGIIQNTGNSTKGNSAVWVWNSEGAHNAGYQSSFILEEGALIQNIVGKGVQLTGSYDAYVSIAGKITGIQGDQALNINSGINANTADPGSSPGTLKCVIESTGEIINNNVANGAVYIQTDKGILDIYGKINNNIDPTNSDCPGGIWLAHNQHLSTVTMYPGAEICNNSANKCGGIMVSQCTFTMKGGTISGNIARNSTDESAGGVLVRNGGTFIMEGGTISNNSSAGAGGGIGVRSSTWGRNSPSSAQLLDGVIQDNIMNVTVTGSVESGYVVNGGTSNDVSVVKESAANISCYLTIGEDMTLGNPDVYMQKYDFTLLDPQRGTKLGNANTACETAVTTKYTDEYLTDVKGSFWYQSEEDLVLRLSGLQYDTAKPLLVSIVETKADGTPADGAEPTLQAVSPDEDGVISLPLSDNENGYAVVFVQESQPSGIITVVPANLTAYMGGEGGYESVVDEEGNVVGEENTSLPRPIFKVTGPKGVVLKSLTFKNKESNNAWKLEPASEGSSYYRFVPVTGDTEVRVQYDDGYGPVTEDTFTPSIEGDVFKEYTVTIYSGNTSGNKVEAGYGGNHYTVVTGAGILTVRAVNNEQDEAVTAIQETVTKPASGSAVAVEPKGGTTYTLNDTDVQLPHDAAPSLLFDDIIEDEGSTARTDALKDKADDTIGSESENRQYQIKYLDLVDANNGNAWITSSKGIDIYWAYPAGTSSSTEFTLLHFEGLHRDGANSGYNVSDINSVDPEELTIEKTANGIKFHVEPGSFSPFALVWEEAAVTPPVTPSEPADPDDTGVSDLLDTENHNQYLFGYPEGTFGPDQNMTRAEVAQMFYNLLVDKNVAITASFEDVPADAWYAKSVNTLASMGIISGVGENRFEPERSITRAEFTSMAMKFTKGALDGTNVFSDVHSGDWFYEAVVGSIQYGWIEGYEDGTFRPENRITRVEVTSIVNKMLGRFADREFVAGHADELNSFSDVTSTHWGYYHIVEATNSHRYTKPSTNVETWTGLK